MLRRVAVCTEPTSLYFGYRPAVMESVTCWLLEIAASFASRDCATKYPTPGLVLTCAPPQAAFRKSQRLLCTKSYQCWLLPPASRSIRILPCGRAIYKLLPI